MSSFIRSTAASGAVSTGVVTAWRTNSAARDVEKWASMIASCSASSGARAATSSLCVAASPWRSRSIARSTTIVLRVAAYPVLGDKFVELVCHGGDRRRESGKHADPIALGKGRLEHGFVRLQDRHRKFRLHAVDGWAEGRAGDEDAVGPDAMGIAAKIDEALYHAFRQITLPGAVNAQAVIEEVDGLSLGPALGEGLVDGLHRYRSGMKKNDARWLRH